MQAPLYNENTNEPFDSAEDKPVECPPGLFDKINLTVKLGKELKHTRKLLFLFTSLLLLAIIGITFSLAMFTKQLRDPRTNYVLSGSIISKDNESFIIQTSDGLTRTIFYSNTMDVKRVAPANMDELGVGKTVIVNSRKALNGSLRAQSIQVWPAGTK